MAIKIARLPNFNVANGALEGLTVRVGRLFYRCRFAFPHKERRNEVGVSPPPASGVDRLCRRRRRRTVFQKMDVSTLSLLYLFLPVPHLPFLFQGVSASGLPTKSISLTPIKDPGTNFFEERVLASPEPEARLTPKKVVVLQLSATTISNSCPLKIARSTTNSRTAESEACATHQLPNVFAKWGIGTIPRHGAIPNACLNLDPVPTSPVSSHAFAFCFLANSPACSHP